MTLPMAKIVLTVLSIWVVIALCKARVVVYGLNAVWITEIAVMLVIIWDIVNNRFTAVSFSSYSVWDFCDIWLPVLMKSDHSDVAVETISNAYLVVRCRVVFLVNFYETMCWKLVIIKHRVHVSKGVEFKSSESCSNIMPLVICIPPISRDVILMELPHEIEPHSLYIHINPKHHIKPTPVNINLINNLPHNFCHFIVMIIINVSSHPGFNGEVLIMRQLPDIVGSEIPIFVEQVASFWDFPRIVLVEIVKACVRGVWETDTAAWLELGEPGPGTAGVLVIHVIVFQILRMREIRLRSDQDVIRCWLFS